MPPLISAVVPTFNRADVLGRALRSVMCQTMDEWELIVVDDGSTDSTPDIVCGMADERIRYVRHDIRRGASAARNTGIRTAAGEYVAFLDSDDEWVPSKLERQLKVFQSTDLPDVGLVYGGICVDWGHKVEEVMPLYRGKVDRVLVDDILILGTGILAMIPSAIAREVGGFDPQMPTREEHDLWLRIAQNYNLDYTPHVVAKTYKAVGVRSRLSEDVVSGVRGMELFVAKHHAIIRETGTEAKWLRRIASGYRDVGEWGAALRLSAEAFRRDWRTPRSYVHLASCAIPYPIYQRLRAFRSK